LGGLWDRLTGEHAKIRKQNELEAYWSLQRDREQRHALVSAQMRERQALQQKIRALRQDQANRLRELHRDLHRYGELRQPQKRDRLAVQFEQAAHPRPKTAQERLNDLRSRKPKDRGRDFER
jgi:hypothetical protein